MAAGDAYIKDPVSVAANGFLDLQPAANTEIVVHNVYVNGTGKAVEFYFYDGTNSILFDSDTADGSRQGVAWHCTNTRYVRVKNVSGAALLIAADGMYTK